MRSLQLILTKLRFFAPCFVFASLNIITSTWVLYIPYVKQKLQISDGELGVALFCFALGVLVIIPFVPKITMKLGLGRYTLIGIISFSLVFIFPLLAESFIGLSIALFFVGVFSGSTDVAMNALVSEIEKKENESIMSAAHGFFSLGGVIGAGLGSVFLIGQLSPLVHMLLVILLVIICNMMLFKNYRSIKSAALLKQKEKISLDKLQILYIIAILAFIIMASEGAIEHWSKLYLLEVVTINSDQVAGYGFVMFSAAMTIGRFFGDGISDKIGSKAIISIGILIAVLGFGFVLLQTLMGSLLGFTLVGLGLSVVIPELFRIAGRANNIPAAVGISFVSGIGFVGFLIGPVLLGVISDNYGLKMSFITLFVVIVIAFLLSLMYRAKNIVKQ